tara:strand:- start:688 stop:1320 length:633 start_codon:yes stop_codon:yes gene_type:complete
MGFSGGGSNILKPHTHNGLTVLDGGSLNFNNITQSQSTAGMVFFSDGTHLQQLAYPGVPAGETLTAAAASTAPSWQAAAAGVSVDIDSAALTSAFTTGATSPTDVTGLVITIPTIASGQVLINANPSCATTAAGALNTQLTDDGIYIEGTCRRTEGFSNQQWWINAMTHVMGADGSVVQVQVWSGGVTTSCTGASGSGNATSNIVSLGVG